MNEFEKQYYESEAFWNANALADPANTQRIEYTASLVPEDVLSIADIGCGNGLFLKRVRTLRPALVTIGIDRSQEALRHVDGERLIGDVTEIPLGDRSYDCVVCSQVLEHIPVPVYRSALAQLTRISKKYVIVSVPYAEDLRAAETSCPSCLTRFHRDLHLRSYTDDTMRHLLDDFGFKQVHSENLVKSKLHIGLTWLHRMRSRKKCKIFESPLCPICGFVNPDFQGLGPRNSQVAPASRKGIMHSIKDCIKSVWPTRTVDGYWIIGLYQRIR